MLPKLTSRSYRRQRKRNRKGCPPHRSRRAWFTKVAQEKRTFTEAFQGKPASKFHVFANWVTVFVGVFSRLSLLITNGGRSSPFLMKTGSREALYASNSRLRLHTRTREPLLCTDCDVRYGRDVWRERACSVGRWDAPSDDLAPFRRRDGVPLAGTQKLARKTHAASLFGVQTQNTYLKFAGRAALHTSEASESIRTAVFISVAKINLIAASRWLNARPLSRCSRPSLF